MGLTRQVVVIVDLNKDYNRRVVVGIGRYARTALNWSIYLEEDAPAKIPSVKMWRGHGIIAGLDDPQVARTVTGLRVPVVGIGGFSERSMVRTVVGKSVAYVATDNEKVGQMGAEHLLSCGFVNFGFCGLPTTAYNSWASFRARAFRERIGREGFASSL